MAEASTDEPYRTLTDELLMEECCAVLFAFTTILNLIIIYQLRTVDFVNSNFKIFVQARKLMYIILFAPSIYSLLSFLQIMWQGWALWCEALKHIIGGICIFNLMGVVVLSLGGATMTKNILESQTQEARKRGRCIELCCNTDNDFDLFYFFKMMLHLIWLKPLLLVVTFFCVMDDMDTYNSIISFFCMVVVFYSPALCITVREWFLLVHEHAGIKKLDQKVVGILIQSVFIQFQASVVNSLCYFGVFPEVNEDVSQHYQGTYLLAVMNVMQMFVLSMYNFQIHDSRDLFTAFTSNAHATREQFLTTKLTMN